MQAVVFQSTEQVACVDLPDPQLQAASDAIVAVRMAGLCGSDLHPYFGRELGLDPGTVMGHEMVGAIVDVGSDVREFSPGDQVFAPFTTNCGTCFYCQHGWTGRCEQGQLFGWVEQGIGLHGCQSEFVRIPFADATLKKVPQGLTAESALLLADNFSTGYYCAEMADVTPEGVYVVIGCGNVGQLALMAARSLGAQTLVAVDPVAERRVMAEKSGALSVAPENALALVMELTDGRGADAVMEVVGMPDAQRLAYQLIRCHGVMSVVGCHCTPHFSFGPMDAFNKNLTYRTGRCSARHYMDQLTDRVVAGEFPFDELVTHRYSLSDGPAAYRQFAHRTGGCIKAVFEP